MGVSFPGKKRYGGVRFNVISITRGWVGVIFPGKKRYITHEWPLWACDAKWEHNVERREMKMEVQRRRKRGRPKRRWLDRMRGDIKEKGLSGKEVYDQTTWRCISSNIATTICH